MFTLDSLIINDALEMWGAARSLIWSWRANACHLPALLYSALYMAAEPIARLYVLSYGPRAPFFVAYIHTYVMLALSQRLGTVTSLHRGTSVGGA